MILLILFQQVYSYKPIDATQYMGAGVDAKKAIFGLAPIFQLTYTSNKTWTSPHSNITFKVPDQIATSSDTQTQEIVLQNSYKTYQHYLYEYTAHWNFDVNIGVSYASLGYKYNKELAITKETLDTQTKTMMHGNHVWYFYVATLYPAFILNYDPMFQMALNKLPQKIVTSNDLTYYNEFITTFGTHFMTRALFGAKVNFNAYTDDSLMQSHSSEWVSTQYGFYFHSKLFNISSGGFKNQSDIKVSEQFLKQVNAKINFYGGDPSLSNLNNLTDWTDTIDQFTYPINSTMNGIWELVTTDIIKQQTLKSFVINYMNSDLKLSRGKKIIVNDKSKLNNKLDLTCIGHGFNELNVEGCLAPLFQYTYNKDNLPNEVYVTYIPDSILGNINVTMTDIFNGNTWEHWYHKHHGWFGSSSKEVYKFYSEYFQSSKSLVSNWLEISYQALTLVDIPPLKLDPMFQLALNKLPKIYNNDTMEIYFEFLGTFGTAFAYEIVYGGKFTFDIWYNSTYIHTESIEWIKKNSHWSFMGFIGGGHGSSYTSQYVDKEFHESLLFEYSYQGGNIQSYGYNQWKLWLASIKDNQMPLKWKLMPITFTISDTLIKNNVNLALVDYAKNSELNLAKYIQAIKH